MTPLRLRWNVHLLFKLHLICKDKVIFGVVKSVMCTRAAWLSDFLRSICDNEHQFCVFQEYIRAVKVFSVITLRKQAGLIQTLGLDGFLLEVGVEVMLGGCFWHESEVTFGESEPPHALLQIKIQPRGGLKGSTDVQQRMGTEPKTTDSEPRECLSYVGSWHYILNNTERAQK